MTQHKTLFQHANKINTVKLSPNSVLIRMSIKKRVQNALLLPLLGGRLENPEFLLVLLRGRLPKKKKKLVIFYTLTYVCTSLNS